MKRSLVALSLFATLVGCSTPGRQPASDLSPEIEAKRNSDLAASNLQAGDSLVFNRESRFEVGADRLTLGTDTYPRQISCDLVVVPPRGERVQNYVPAGKILTITSARFIQKGRPGVEVFESTKRKAITASILAGLRERGYMRKEDFKGSPTKISYSLSGSSSNATLECVVTNSRHEILMLGVDNLADVDKSMQALIQPLTIGDMNSILPRTYSQFRKAWVEFKPAARPEIEYRKIPINYEVPVQRFEDIPQNSI